MSGREKRLLVLLLGLLFVVGNVMLYTSVYSPMVTRAKNDLRKAEKELKLSQFRIKGKEERRDDLAWLQTYEPEPTSIQDVKTNLQRTATLQAQNLNIEIINQTFGAEIIDTGLTYHRARFQIEVNGYEKDIYQWLDRLQAPNEFRAVTYMRLQPLRDDNTKAEYEVFIDQWFVPQS